MTVVEQLRRDEGSRLDPYPDVAARPNRDELRQLWDEFVAKGGSVAVGYGRNLTYRKLSLAEAQMLLDNDVAGTVAEVVAEFPWAVRLDEPRRGVLVNMAYNLGLGGLKTFRRMLAACEARRWHEAKVEMLDSVWARQVGPRAARLAEQMETGRWQ